MSISCKYITERSTKMSREVRRYYVGNMTQKCLIALRSSLFWDVTQHWLVVIDVSGQPIRPILNGQSLLDCLTLEDGTDRLSPNDGNYQLTLLNIPKELRPHLHRTGSMNLCLVLFV